MESIKDIITVGQKVIAHKGYCSGIIIHESNKELTVTKVNKKSFIAGGINEIPTSYPAPQLESYLETENTFEDQIRRCLRNERERYMNSQDWSEEQLEESSERCYELFRDLMQ